MGRGGSGEDDAGDCAGVGGAIGDPGDTLVRQSQLRNSTPMDRSGSKTLGIVMMHELYTSLSFFS
jgi:hypothetical protein